MKITKELRQLDEKALQSRLKESKKELLKLKGEVGTGSTGASSPGKLRQTKKNLARILTLLKEKEVNGK